MQQVSFDLFQPDNGNPDVVGPQGDRVAYTPLGWVSMNGTTVSSVRVAL